jgi:hypothetical protein
MVGAVPKLDPQIAALSHQWIFRKCGNLRIRCLRTKSCFLICGFGIRGLNSFPMVKTLWICTPKKFLGMCFAD